MTIESCDVQFDLGYPDSVNCNQPEGHDGDHAFTWTRAEQAAQEAEVEAAEQARQEGYRNALIGWPHHHMTMDWWREAKAAR